jgi:tRNA(Ile)-lysidine synthase
VEKVCKKLKVPLRWTTLSSVELQGKGLEATWRDMRYDFLDKSERAVVTAHHLDDAVEWWVFSSLHGEGKLIPRIRGNYLRPMLLTRKDQLIKFCDRSELPYHVDETNLLIDRPRVLIRNKKKYLKEIQDERQGW